MYKTENCQKFVGTKLYRSIMNTAKSQANERMNREGRKSWDDQDHALFTKTFFLLMQQHAGYRVE